MKSIVYPKISVIILILFIFSMIFQSGFLFNQKTYFLSNNALGDSVSSTFQDGQSEVIITFNPGGGTDTSAKFKLPKGAEVLSASFNVTGLKDNQDNYPTNVNIDVGDDGDLEWDFNLSSVGSLGKQTGFIGSLNNKFLVLNKGLSDESLVIRLPKQANILNSNLNLEGFFHGIPNGDFESGSMVGWNVATNTYSDDVMITNIRNGNYPASSWGAFNNYLMLRSIPFGTHDWNCNIIVDSDYFPKFDVNYITMSWDLVERDDFNLYLRVYDDTNSYVTARSFGGDDNVDHIENMTKQTIDVSTLTGNNLMLRLNLRDGFWMTSWGRLAVDNIYISDATGKRLPNYPTNVTVDAGNDGTDEFSIGSLVGIEPVTGLVNALNNLLINPSQACQFTTDKYGNEFVDIPLNITVLSSPGMINVTDLDIEYEYTAEVNKNPRGTLVDELNSLIPSNGVGNVTIPISVKSTTAGRIKISDIMIKYNSRPVTKTIPDINIFEDSLNSKILDLTKYFSDDSQQDQLKFEISSNSEPNKLDVRIEDGKYLTLDSNLEPNWFGNVTMTIRASDNHDLSSESKPFKVNVLSVNDEPYVNIPISDIKLWEDSPGIELSLGEVPYFKDVENDKLYFSVSLDPTGKVPNSKSNLDVHINSNNQLIIRPSKDWFGYNIPIILYCDDDDQPIDTKSNSPQQQFTIDIQSINDPPELEPFNTIFLDEDENADDIVNLKEKASDIETSVDNLRFTILSNDNEENIMVSIDDEKNLDVDILTKDYVGASKVKLQVMDEAFATDEKSFSIIINPVNDGPRILHPFDSITMMEDTIDSTSMNLFNIFYDPDSPIIYTVDGNQHIKVSFSTENGKVTFNPDKDWFGVEKIRFSAQDTFTEIGSAKKSISTIVNVSVLPINDPPNTPTIISPQEPRTDVANHEVVFESEDAFDVDSQQLVYYWDFDNRVDSDSDGDPTNDMNGIGQKIQYKYPISGYYLVTLYVSDGELNCTTPAKIYVQVTTNIDKATEEYSGEENTFLTDILLSVLLILIIIILIFWLFFTHRKNKKEQLETMDSREPMKPDKPPVIEGELISAPYVPSNLTTVSSKAKTPIPPKQAQSTSSRPTTSTSTGKAPTVATPTISRPAPSVKPKPPTTAAVPKTTSNQNSPNY